MSKEPSYAGDDFIAHRCRNGKWRPYCTHVCSGCFPYECIDVVFKSRNAFKEMVEQEKRDQLAAELRKTLEEGLNHGPKNNH
jgi:hypothetical protein